MSLYQSAHNIAVANLTTPHLFTPTRTVTSVSSSTRSQHHATPMAASLVPAHPNPTTVPVNTHQHQASPTVHTASVAMTQKKLDQCHKPYRAVFTVPELEQWYAREGLQAWEKAFETKKSEIMALLACLGPEWKVSNAQQAFKLFQKFNTVRLSEKTKHLARTQSLQSPSHVARAHHNASSTSLDKWGEPTGSSAVPIEQQAANKVMNWWDKLQLWVQIVIIIGAVVAAGVSVTIAARACVGYRLDQHLCLPCVCLGACLCLCCTIALTGECDCDGGGDFFCCLCDSESSGCDSCINSHTDTNKGKMFGRRSARRWWQPSDVEAGRRQSQHHNPSQRDVELRPFQLRGGPARQAPMSTRNYYPPPVTPNRPIPSHHIPHNTHSGAYSGLYQQD